MQLLSIGKAAAQLGVAVATLRRWHRQGRLAPVDRTIGGHRRYERESVRAILGSEVREVREVRDHLLSQSVIARLERTAQDPGCEAGKN